MPVSTQPQETLVSMRTPEGIRVYPPAEPTAVAIVTGTRRVPTCTCLDFQKNIQIDPNFYCQHIEAVMNDLPDPPDDEPTPEEERAAIQSEGRAPRDERPAAIPPEGQLTLKRSMSPDGRIDSLSVEFACPLPGTVGAVKTKAYQALGLGDEIVQAFRRQHTVAREPPAHTNGHGGGNGNGTGYRPPANGGHAGGAGPDGPVPATLISIGGMQTRSGWSFFINVQANGQVIRLFGRKNELGQAIATAGYPHMSDNIQQGVQLNLPCRVIVSQNGRYARIEQVLPATHGQPAPGGYRR